MIKTKNSTLNLGKQFTQAFENYINTKKDLYNLKKVFKEIRKHLDNKGYILIKKFEVDKHRLFNKIKSFSKISKIIKQNKKGDTLVEVKPNNKLIKSSKNDLKKNIRYHQSSIGGSIHTDGPQILNPPRYVLMACVEQASKGGESVIVDMQKIYVEIKKKNKNILKILKNNFFFEMKGFKDKTFSKPIFSHDEKKKLHFRYLREYIESAYKIRNKKMSKKQIIALNFLDRTMNKNKFQIKYKLNKGDLVILNNKKFSHGRTSFKVSKNNNRNLLRVWLN